MSQSWNVAGSLRTPAGPCPPTWRVWCPTTHRSSERRVGRCAVGVEEHGRALDPDISAAEACAERPHFIAGQASWFPGAAAAAIQGRIAAVNICGGAEEYPGALGTIIIRLFEAPVARTRRTAHQA